MERIFKSIVNLNNSNRWDYHFHQQQFTDLEASLAASPFPLHTVEQLTEQVIDGTHYTPEYTDSSGILFLMARNVRPFEINLDTVSYITQAEHQKLLRCKPQSGDVLVTKDGTIGVAAVVPDSLPEFNIFVSVIKIRPREIISPHYLTAFLNSELGQMQIRQQVKGASITHIHLEDMRRLKIPLPPRDIQDRIAQLMQDAYAARQAKLAEAQRLLGGIDDNVLEGLNVDVSLINFEKKFTVQSSELNSKWRVENHDIRGIETALLNGHFPVNQVNTFSVFVTDKIRPDTDFKYIEIGSINTLTGEIITSELLTCNGITAPNNAQRQIREGDILISTRRPTRGAISVVPSSLDGEICTLFFSIIRINADIELLAEYVAAFLRTDVGRLQIQRAITATTYPVISDADVSRFLVPVPPIEIQQAIIDDISERKKTFQKLQIEAQQIIDAAKAKVERLILDGETI
ncbi:MAG: restriction endonuclease subunit S [Chloroflexota bacterium]